MAKWAEDCVMDEFRQWANEKRATGTLVCGSPFEMQINFNPTFRRGGAFNVYNSLVQEMPKWEFAVKKVDEWMEVSPVFEYYKLTVEQKQRLEEAIKKGLTSAASAVSDYELVAHDERRYEEVLNYFEQAKKTGNDHVLRNLFVDRIDAYTGEGYSLITMAKRWPTIITDFIRMDTEWTDPEKYPTEKEQRDKIRKELDVSMAEATILKTKNDLYREWKELFLPEIQERYARIKNLAQARRKSIQRYREWLRPYIAKYRSMRETSEKDVGEWMLNPQHTPGFGQSEAWTGVRLWTWKYLTPTEFRKPEIVTEEAKYGFAIDPYDDVVREWKKKIEDKYNVTITDGEVRDMLRESAETGGDMKRFTVYYAFFDIEVLLQLLKTPPPEGMEIDDIVFWVRGWYVSQNVILLHKLELEARKRYLENYIDEIIGAKNIEDRIREEVEKKFQEEEESRLQRLREFKERMGPMMEKVRNGADDFVHIFIKRGPYETVQKERLTQVYTRVVGPYYKQIVNFLKAKSGVPMEG